jgi:ATP-dependent NAD(P)H-hydrate dehydratase
MEAFSRHLPPLGFSLYKGQSGRVGIIGGCFEYTGAPYFAGAAVLRLGGDLSHIFCAKSAAIPIKSYSPDQIVHPYLPDPDEHSFIDTAVENVMKWSASVQTFVIGPGLGRNSATLDFAEKFVETIKSSGKPLIIDGDALFLVSQKPSLVQGCQHFILTPNGGEFIRLQDALSLPRTSTPLDIAKALGGVTIFAKGKNDVVSNGTDVETFAFAGSPRRVGGQGDITAGALGLFCAWVPGPKDFFAAAAAASEVVRCAARAAFDRSGRATITTDILSEISHVLPKSWSVVGE